MTVRASGYKKFCDNSVAGSPWQHGGSMLSPSQKHQARIQRGGYGGWNPHKSLQMCSGMHQNAPFRRRKCQNFSGEGAQPLPRPPIEEGDTPSPDPTPVDAFGASIWVPSAPDPPDHISGYGPEKHYHSHRRKAPLKPDSKAVKSTIAVCLTYFSWMVATCCHPSVLWCCWLGNRKGIWLVKTSRFKNPCLRINGEQANLGFSWTMAAKWCVGVWHVCR